MQSDLDAAPLLSTHVQRGYDPFQGGNRGGLRAAIAICVGSTLGACTFGGVSSMLGQVLVENYHKSGEYTNAVVSVFEIVTFVAACAGGWIADMGAGALRMVQAGLAASAVGGLFVTFLCLPAVGLSESAQVGILIFGSMIMGAGNGTMLSATSTLLGHQFTAESIGSAYRWYYISFNVGVWGSSIIAPILAESHGGVWSASLLVALTAAIGVGVMVWSTPLYVQEAPRTSHVPIMETMREYKTSLKFIAAIIAPFPLFWCLFFNIYGLWTLSASVMNLQLGSYSIPPGQMVSLNPLFDMLLIPVFDLVIYPAFKRFRGYDAPPVPRMACGMAAAALALFTAAWLQVASDANSNLSVLWQVPQYILICCAEIMSSITGLEFAFTFTPPPLKSLVMGAWYLTQAGGNLLLFISSFFLPATAPAPALYFTFSGVMAVFAVVFAWYTAKLPRPPTYE